MMGFEDILQGGDRRSTGGSDQAAALVDAQATFDSLFDLIFHPDRAVSMRAADAVEKVSKRNPEYLASHRAELFALCGQVQNIELKWHLALMLARLKLAPEDLAHAWEILETWALDKKESKIVRVNSLQGLSELAGAEPGRMRAFIELIKKLELDPVPSISARIRQLQKKLWIQ